MPSGGKREVRTNSETKTVSGPGALSERVDMTPSDQVPSDPKVYGDRKRMQGEISGMSNAQPVQPKVPSLPGLFEPTQNAEEPVTAGNPLGAGPGPESLNLPAMSYNPASTLSRLAQSDPSGKIELILQDMQMRGL